MKVMLEMHSPAGQQQLEYLSAAGWFDDACTLIRNAAKWHFIPTSELYAEGKTEFPCLQVFMQLDQAGIKACWGL